MNRIGKDGKSIMRGHIELCSECAKGAVDPVKKAEDEARMTCSDPSCGACAATRARWTDEKLHKKKKTAASTGLADFVTGVVGPAANMMDRALATHPPEKFTLRHEERHWVDGGDRFYVDRNGETFALCPDLAAAERIIEALSGDE